MQLKTHPKMKWEGFPNWPPAWVGSYGRGDVFPGEEEGVLTGVDLVEANSRSARHLKLRGEHGGNMWGALIHCETRMLSHAFSRFSKAASAGR